MIGKQTNAISIVGCTWGTLKTIDLFGGGACKDTELDCGTGLRCLIWDLVCVWELTNRLFWTAEPTLM